MSSERVTLEGEAVAACPDCDTAGVWRRDGGPQTSPGHEYACYECGWRGDDYRERDSRHNVHMDGNVKPRPGTLAYELADADPDDLVTDGGTVEACRECDSTRLRERNHMAATSPYCPGDPEYRCKECGNEMHEPKRRPAYPNGAGSGHTKALVKADPDDLVTDGGAEIESEWTLDCMDCSWSETAVGTEHPAVGPPEEVEKKVRVHKNTADESHTVRVKGVHSPEDREIDPSLITDGGEELRLQCFNADCSKSFDSFDEMVAVQGRDHRSPRHFCEECAEPILRGPPITDGGVPQFDRVATGICESCGDEVAIRWLDGGECIGCRERREIVADGGRDVFEHDPNRLSLELRPAVIGEHTKEGTVKFSVADVDLHESGALQYTRFDGRKGTIPEWRWTEVQYLETDTQAGGVEMYRSVLDEDWHLLPDPIRDAYDPVEIEDSEVESA